ncbi:uncharacterized protein LOC129581563 [Paramacrobiotus metropolitanus]|uniref:uncharacterized protein LOC129581563 n=1 Tax=Paramacrobiotus metropolitanus TaxID=2943436 RepID=UPI002445F73F|nr:uncharacterized protein LOC129581563 [Paramacrobiotus metropolitanus]
MHLYKDPKHPINAWNSVDVLVDGFLQQGHVLDVAKDGLVIDFHCAGQRAQLVKYGSIFRFPSSSSSAKDSLPSTAVVQVLLHRSPDGAWIWYPGTLVGLGDYHHQRFVCVQVEVPLYGTILEMVPRVQVRPHPADADWEGGRVMDKDFVVCFDRLPEAHRAGGSPIFVEILKGELEREFPIVCIALCPRERSLRYLQRQDGWPLSFSQLRDVFTWVLVKEKAQSGSRRARQLTGITTDTPGKGEGMPLPPVLLLEVFRSLDSIERFRYRRVCPLWHTLLTTDGYFSDVYVYGSSEYTCWPAGLIKCLTRSTRVLVLDELMLGDAIGISGLIRHLLNGSRLQAVVFYGCEFSPGFGAPVGAGSLMGRLTGLVVQWSVADRV